MGGGIFDHLQSQSHFLHWMDWYHPLWHTSLPLLGSVDLCFLAFLPAPPSSSYPHILAVTFSQTSTFHTSVLFLQAWKHSSLPPPTLDLFSCFLSLALKWIYCEPVMTDMTVLPPGLLWAWGSLLFVLLPFLLSPIMTTFQLSSPTAHPVTRSPHSSWGASKSIRPRSSRRLEHALDSVFLLLFF